MEDEAATATGALGAARDASGMEGGDRVERMELSDEDMSGIRTPSGLGLAEEAINTSTDPAPVPAAAVAISGTEQELESGNGGGGDATNAVDGPIPPEVGPETRDSGADETATGAAEKEVDAGEVEPDATAEKDDAAEETTRPQDSPSKAPGAVGRPSLRPRKIAVPFSMPVHLQRVSVKYGEPAVEYHGTVYHLEGWPTAESVMVVFDDGDTHRFSAIDVRGCMNAGGWALLDATSHWHGKGCVQGVECSQVAGIIAIKPPRSKKAKLEGIWIGTSHCLGRDKVTTYETFKAMPGSRPEYRSMPYGAVVLLEGEAMVCWASMRVPLTDETPAKQTKYRMASLVVRLSEAWAGAVPCLTLNFLGSESAWQVVPMAKLTHADLASTEATLHAPKNQFTVRESPSLPFFHCTSSV